MGSSSHVKPITNFPWETYTCHSVQGSEYMKLPVNFFHKLELECSFLSDANCVTICLHSDNEPLTQLNLQLNCISCAGPYHGVFPISSPAGPN